ncbi:MAG TPA: hypothetical protein VH309_06055 [Elusimicrobiota bacterium]|jgi:hypothetical protein|nr:hypothetical protein [Elusimicrobiota bacterium]
MIIPNKTMAWFGASGTLCDALGGVYLTYDLLGGRTGPLGLVTRTATYGCVFALGYGLVFGPFFGVVCGLGLGGLLGLEFWRVAHHQRKYGHSPLYNLPRFGVARGLILGFAATARFGLEFGGIFGALNAAFLYVVYRLRYAPTYDYDPRPDAGANPHARKAAFMRAAAIGASGALTGLFLHRRLHAVPFGLTIGVVVGLVSLVIGAVSPRLEYYVENLPERHLAAFGFALIALGLLLQSVQYAVVILGPG